MCHFFVYSYCACACTCIHVGVHMLVCFLTNSFSPPSTISVSLSVYLPPSLSLSLSLSFPRSPLSLWDTDSDQVVLPLCSPQCGQVCCLLSICSKLEEAAELLLYIDSNNVLFVSFLYMTVFMHIIKGWC